MLPKNPGGHFRVNSIEKPLKVKELVSKAGGKKKNYHTIT